MSAISFIRVGEGVAAKQRDAFANVVLMTLTVRLHDGRFVPRGDVLAVIAEPHEPTQRHVVWNLWRKRVRLALFLRKTFLRTAEPAGHLTGGKEIHAAAEGIDHGVKGGPSAWAHHACSPGQGAIGTLRDGSRCRWSFAFPFNKCSVFSILALHTPLHSERCTGSVGHSVRRFPVMCAAGQPNKLFRKICVESELGL